MNCLLQVFSWAHLAVSASIVRNSQLSDSISDKSVTFSAASFNRINKYRNPGTDTDIGPYCVIDPTTNKLQTSTFVSSGFLITNQDCRTNCDLAGCTLYRRDSLAGSTYTKLSHCVVAEAFHFSIAESRQETWCDKFDLRRSVFIFRGQTYIDQWYWLGWGSMNDCMNAILCGPSSHFFDSSQSQSLAWCQPVPPGKFSPTCANSIADCNIPSWADGMKLAVWTSHGFGSAEGCGIRLVTPAIVKDIDVGALTGPVWTVSWTVQFQTPFIIGAETILFGIFLFFSLAIFFISSTIVRLEFFHNELTVSSSTTTVQSSDIQWLPGETRQISISLSTSGMIQFYVDTRFVSESPTVPPLFRASIGRLTIAGFEEILSSDIIHIGPVFVKASDFESSSTNGQNPYTSWIMGTDLTVGDIAFSRSAMTTTTTAVPVSTTVFIPPPVTTQFVLLEVTSRTTARAELVESTTRVVSENTATPVQSTESTTTARETSTTSSSALSEITTEVHVIESTGAIWWIGSVLLLLGFSILTIFGIKEYKRRKKKRRRSSTSPMFPEDHSWIQNVTLPGPEAWSNNYSLTI